MKEGWFDRFSSQEIDRSIDSNGIVSYSITTSNISKFGETEYLTKSSKKVDSLEIFNLTLKSAKKTLTPELKQVIDDIPMTHINDVWGVSDYTQKTPIGHAIDDMNIEALEYLIQKGADVNVSGTNQKHVLQELLASNATDKRVQILEIVLEKLNPQTISITKGFDGNFFSIKYLIPLINSGQVSDADVKMVYNESKPKQKKTLIENCSRIGLIAPEADLPQLVKDIFFF